MYVNGPDNALLNLKNAGSARMRGGWQVGQLLKAMVVSVDRQGTPTLEINGRQVQAQPQNQSQGNVPLRAGQTLQLEVVRAGEQPLLRVLSPAASRGEVMSRGVRESLPQQQPLTQVLSSLNQLAESAKGETGQQLRALSRQILDQLPQLQQLRTGNAVKQAVEDSGNFLESKLRQISQQGTTPESQAQLSRDLKAGLLRLLQAIRNLPQSNPSQAGGRPGAGASPQPPVPTGGQTSSPGQGPAAPLQGKAAPPPQTPPAPAQNPQNAQTQTSAAAPARPGATPQAQPAADGQAARQVVDTSTARPTQPNVQGGTQPAASQQQPSSSVAPPTTARTSMEATHQVESGLSRIQFNQLSSIQQSDSQHKPSWLLEVPMRQSDGRVDTLQLEIQRDREGDGKEKRAIWTVSLSFELKELGAVRAGLTLVGEKQVGVNLWANEAETVALFNRNMKQLKQSMIDAGLHVSRMGCQQGIPQRSSPQKSFAGEGLVDVKA